MSFELFLAVNIMSISALLVVFALIYRSDGYLASLVPNLLVLALGGLALWLDWSSPGTLVTLIFFPLIVAPIVLAQLSQRRANAYRFDEAARFSNWAAVLQPTERNRSVAQMMSAFAKPDPESVVANLRQMSKSASPAQVPLLEAVTLNAQGDYVGVLDVATRQPVKSRDFAVLKLRALGETGQTEAMVRTFHDLPAGLTGAHKDFCRLLTLVFCGRVQGADTLLSTQMSAMADDYKTYWRATAVLASDQDATQARSSLRTLAETAGNRNLRRAASRRLTEPSRAHASAAFAPMTRSMLDAIEQEATAPPPPRSSTVTRIPATIGLGLMNAAAFAVELWQGVSEDGEGLLRLGALWPPAVLEDGEWWRLFTALFLHLGWLHILSNMFVLFAFARTLEPALGSVRFLICYLVGGLASSAGVLALMSTHVVDEGLLVGASGAIFALFGLMFAFALRRWLRTREDVDKRELINLCVIAGIQSAIDLSLPQISFSAHGVGFLAGLAMGLVLASRGRLGVAGR